MKNIYKNIIFIVVAILATFFILKQCEEEPKIVTTTKIEYVTIRDTITVTEISKPIVKYVQRLKTVKGKDSIVYVSSSDSTAIKANQFSTILKSNNATANLLILTTGELLSVSGTITYTQENKTVETLKTINGSGLFIYGQGSIQSKSQQFGVGLDYVIRNKFIIGTSASYNNFSNTVNFNVKLGIRIL